MDEQGNIIPKVRNIINFRARVPGEGFWVLGDIDKYKQLPVGGVMMVIADNRLVTADIECGDPILVRKINETECPIVISDGLIPMTPEEEEEIYEEEIYEEESDDEDPYCEHCKMQYNHCNCDGHRCRLCGSLLKDCNCNDSDNEDSDKFGTVENEEISEYSGSDNETNDDETNDEDTNDESESDEPDDHKEFSIDTKDNIILCGKKSTLDEVKHYILDNSMDFEEVDVLTGPFPHCEETATTWTFAMYPIGSTDATRETLWNDKELNIFFDDFYRKEVNPRKLLLSKN